MLWTYGPTGKADYSFLTKPISLSYQDQSSCNHFYHCTSGSFYKKKCPNGLVWNTQKNQCDWVSKTNCGARPVTSSGNSGSSVIQQCTCPGNAEECMAAHPMYCNYFFYCINGQKFEKFCPKGLIWSQVSNDSFELHLMLSNLNPEYWNLLRRKF